MWVRCFPLSKAADIPVPEPGPGAVRIRVGEPVPTKGEDVEVDTRAMMSAIVDLLPAEVREQREPTPEELAATYPDGRVTEDVGDAAAHEGDRRPGAD